MNCFYKQTGNPKTNYLLGFLKMILLIYTSKGAYRHQSPCFTTAIRGSAQAVRLRWFH